MLYSAALVNWVGLFSASFCNKMWQLLICQGIILGFGQGMAMPLFMSLPSQWFYKKRGFASGSALAGAGLGGGVWTIVVRKMITPLGYKKTLL
jgi:hypothetical protein